jgi:hypothetical protein
MRTVSRAQVRQPVNVRGLGRWPTYAALLAPLMAERERALRWKVIDLPRKRAAATFEGGNKT